jgi:hypothetical protein
MDRVLFDGPSRCHSHTSLMRCSRVLRFPIPRTTDVIYILLRQPVPEAHGRWYMVYIQEPMRQQRPLAKGRDAIVPCGPPLIRSNHVRAAST